MLRKISSCLINGENLLTGAAGDGSKTAAQIPTAIGHQIPRAGETENPDDRKVVAGGNSETSRRHLVAWIWQECSKIRHLWRLTDSEVSSRLAYPCKGDWRGH